MAWWEKKDHDNRTEDILRHLGPLFRIIICRMYNVGFAGCTTECEKDSEQKEHEVWLGKS